MKKCRQYRLDSLDGTTIANVFADTVVENEGFTELLRGVIQIASLWTSFGRLSLRPGEDAEVQEDCGYPIIRLSFELRSMGRARA